MDTPLAFPALHASHAGIWMGISGGQVQTIGKGEAAGRAAETPMVMLNAPLVAQRLGYPDLSGLDLLELYAFVYPARFAVPTPKGLAKALDLATPATDQEVPQFLIVAARKLLSVLGDPAWAEREGAWDSAQALMRLRWPWANLVLAQIKKPERPERWLFGKKPRPAPRHAS